MSGHVLLSWLALLADPFQRKHRSTDFELDSEGQPIPGPTLDLLFDPTSPYRNEVDRAVFLRLDSAREARIFAETRDEIARRAPGIKVEEVLWNGTDPTDLNALYGFLDREVPRIRESCQGQPLVVHFSPGTSAMATLWLLLVETGQIAPPVTLVKTFRPKDRRGRRAVEEVSLGLETFYRRYRASLPLATSEDDTLLFDPRSESPVLRELFREARRCAQLKVPVLLLGERGTGKTTLATSIRAASPFCRPDLGASWAAVPCGQYDAQTMRSELFGYKKGAFTGAVRDHDGLLAVADGDTLFLDEVGDVSPDLQRLLIRALEDGTYQPLGSNKTLTSDFRLLTATNRPWSELAERLDADFLDRISMLTLRVPPLRDTRDDIDRLWSKVYERAARRSRAPRGLLRLGQKHHRRIVSALRAHPLPGNLRDLYRVAYRLLAARADPDEPLSPADAVHYALGALASGPLEPEDRNSALARAFADRRSLDSLVRPGTPLGFDSFNEQFRQWGAREVRRLAKVHGTQPEELCTGAKERALRNWAKE